ncbi:MAG: sulfurtransferase [Alphaproteobacteria bacterium]|nr:sulfurtransferase [Alphaproteobacteria bacterium]MCB9929558.1 sulfurtransferase [Alphaproteobacteria bacterium]
MTLQPQHFLVETDWLEAHLGDPGLRVLDSTIAMTRQPDGGWQPTSGRDGFEKGHIPGAQFVDLMTELQDRTSRFAYALPTVADFEAKASALGIGPETQVVIYTAAVPWWATRLWWMFRVFGHERVAVLNGGLGKWQAEERSLTAASAAYPPADFRAAFQPALVADKAQVLAAVESGQGCVLNALSRQLFTGESDLGYARPGRIAGSELLPTLGFIDQKTGAYRPDADLAAAADGLGRGKDAEIISYCGGGIAATMNAFVLMKLGYRKVSVYDGSLAEWSADPAMPMETGEPG